MTCRNTLPPALVDALAGNYELLQEIGRGGMGVVYAGRDVRLDRLVAIKVLPDIVSTDAVRERFLREAKAAARLSHPSIVPIYSADDRNGVTYMVMAYVDGTTLTARLRDGNALSADDAVPILRDVALALHAAHARGVIHRDVKPENILVDRLTGRAMMTDFGIARLADAMQSGALTRTGQVLGTVGYMSPEQVTGADVDGRSDLYSLGVLAFETLTGKLPFDGPAPVVIVAHATKPAPPLASVAPHLPAELCAIVDRLLRKDPADRFATGNDVAVALEHAVGTTVATTPTRLATSGEDRVLSEKEADRVWKRAAELQAGIGTSSIARAPTSSVTIMPKTETSGFRLEHVRQAAVEAGISASYVTLALDELLRREVNAVIPMPAASSISGVPGPLRVPLVQCLNPQKSRLLGAPGSLLYEVEVAGQISPDDFDVIAHSIRATFGEAGVTNTLGRSLSWTSAGFNRQRRLHVSVSASGGRTHIRAEENLREFAGVTMGGIVFGFGGIGGALTTAAALSTGLGALSMVVPVAAVGAAYSFARALFTRNARTRASELQGLVERLAVQCAVLIADDQAARTLPRSAGHT